MNCSPYDLRDYIFNELAADQRRAVDSHLRQCPGCQQELQRYQVMESALLQVADEEMPRRIAFVSDQVLAPKPWEARFWSGLWNSGPRLGFAAASMLSAALIFHAVYPNPQSTSPTSPQVSGLLPAASNPTAGAGGVQAVSVIKQASTQLATAQPNMQSEEVRALVAAEVAKALAERQVQHRQEMGQYMASIEQRFSKQREQDLMAMEASFDLYRRKQNRTIAMLTSYEENKPVNGGVQ